MSQRDSRAVRATVANLQQVNEASDELVEENQRLKDQLENIKREIELKTAERRRQRITRGKRSSEHEVMSRLAERELEYEHLGHEVLKLQSTNESLQEDMDEQNSVYEELLRHVNDVRSNAVDMRQLHYDSQRLSSEIEQVQEQLSVTAREKEELKKLKKEAKVKFQETRNRKTFGNAGNLRKSIALRKSMAARKTGMRKTINMRQTAKEQNMRVTGVLENQEELIRQLEEEEALLAEEDKRLQELHEQKDELEDLIVQGQHLIADLEAQKEEMDEEYELETQTLKTMITERDKAILKHSECFVSLQEKHESIVEQEGISEELIRGESRKTEFLGTELELDSDFALQQAQMHNAKLKETLSGAFRKVLSTNSAARQMERLHQDVAQKRLDIAEREEQHQDLLADVTNSVPFSHEVDYAAEEGDLSDPEIHANEQEVLCAKKDLEKARAIQADRRSKLDALGSQIAELRARLDAEGEDDDPLMAARRVFNESHATVKEECARERETWNAAINAAEATLQKEKDRECVGHADIAKQHAEAIVDVKDPTKGSGAKQHFFIGDVEDHADSSQKLTAAKPNFFIGDMDDSINSIGQPAKATEERHRVLVMAVSSRRQRMQESQDKNHELEKEMQCQVEASQVYREELRQCIEAQQHEIDKQLLVIQHQGTALQKAHATRAVEAVLDSERLQDSELAATEMEEMKDLLASVQDMEYQCQQLRATMKRNKVTHKMQNAKRTAICQFKIAQLKCEKEATRRELGKTMRRVEALQKPLTFSGFLSELVCSNKRPIGD